MSFVEQHASRSARKTTSPQFKGLTTEKCERALKKLFQGPQGVTAFSVSESEPTRFHPTWNTSIDVAVFSHDRLDGQRTQVPYNRGRVYGVLEGQVKSRDVDGFSEYHPHVSFKSLDVLATALLSYAKKKGLGSEVGAILGVQRPQASRAA